MATQPCAAINFFSATKQTLIEKGTTYLFRSIHAAERKSESEKQINANRFITACHGISALSPDRKVGADP